MSTSTNLGLTLTGIGSSDVNQTFEDWRLAINGESSSSNMNIIDNAVGELQEDVLNIDDDITEINNTLATKANISDIGTLTSGKINKPTTNPNGTSGQLLRTNGDGTTVWVDEGLPTDEQTAEAVSAWLDDHPEATTTVQDGAITYAKLNTSLKDSIDNAAPIINVTKSGTFTDMSEIVTAKDSEIESVSVTGLGIDRLVAAGVENLIDMTGWYVSQSGDMTVTVYSDHVELSGTYSKTIRLAYNGDNNVPLKKPIASGKKCYFGAIVVGTSSGGDSSCRLNCYPFDSNGVSVISGGNWSARLYGTSSWCYDKTTNAEATKHAITIEGQTNWTCSALKIYPILYVVDDIIKYNSTIPEETTYALNVSTIAGWPYLSTVPYSHDISYKADTKTYIDQHTPEDYISTSNLTQYIPMDYLNVCLSPEMYGAKGDGITDDTNAIATCVSSAISLGVPVRGYGEYKTTSPIDIIGDNLDIYLYKINYTGNSYAVGYQGLDSTINIHYLVSSGVGMYIHSTTSNTLYNLFVFNRIDASFDAVKVYANYSCYQNRLNFCRIKAGSSYSCILFTVDDNPETGWISEWNIVGGYLYNGLWGIKGVMNDTMKFDVHTENLGSDNNGGAFYSTNGGFPSITYARAGEIANHNTLLKVSGVWLSQAPPSLVFPLRVPLVCIDITDLTLPQQTMTDMTQYQTNIWIGAMRGGSGMVTKNLIIWGNRFQFPQYLYRVITVTGNIDMSDQYYTGLIPQHFISDNVIADINLHPTYAANCLHTFVVEQKNGGELDIYDCVGNLIFDGSSYGNGVFELTAYVAPVAGSSMTWLDYNLRNQGWLIRQIT